MLRGHCSRTDDGGDGAAAPSLVDMRHVLGPHCRIAVRRNPPAEPQHVHGRGRAGLRYGKRQTRETKRDSRDATSFSRCRSGNLEPIKRGVEFLTSFQTALSGSERRGGCGAAWATLELDKAETVSGHRFWLTDSLQAATVPQPRTDLYGCHSS